MNTENQNTNTVTVEAVTPPAVPSAEAKAQVKAQEKARVQASKTEIIAQKEKARAEREKARKFAAIERLHGQVENLAAKIKFLNVERKRIQEEAKILHKEVFGHGQRGRGSNNFGKIKPAIIAHLGKMEQALTVRSIAESLGFTYAAVYQTMKNAPETFRLVNKHYMLAKKDEPKTEVKNGAVSVAA